MSDGAIILTVAALAIGSFCCLVWVVGDAMREAERKLGRPLTTGETIFYTVTMPYSVFYIWWVMEDRRRTK
jgi:hypothetical protein